MWIGGCDPLSGATFVSSPSSSASSSAAAAMYLEESDAGSTVGHSSSEHTIQRGYGDTDRPAPHQVRDRFMSSLRSLRNASNKSIRNLAESDDEDRRSSTIVAGYNVTNLIQGIGILGVPYAVVQGSWVGLAAIVVAAAVACSTGKMLVRCLYDPDSGLRVHKTYSCIGGAVWPHGGRQLVTAVCLVEMFGGNTLYVVLLSVEGQRLATAMFGREVSVYACTLILAYAGLPLFFVRRMSVVSWFSLVAVAGLAASLVTLCAFCFAHAAQLSWTDHFPGDFPAGLQGIPLSLGIVTFSYCAHAAFPGIEASMSKPRSFSGMMNVAFTVAAVVKTTVALLFVLLYGSATQQQASMNIGEPAWRVALALAVVVNTFFSLPLTMFVVCEHVDSGLLSYFSACMQQDGRHHWYWLLLSRSCVLTSSVLSAMLVPHFALLMGLIGSLTGCCLTFVFPCIFSLRLHRLSRFARLYRLLVIILGSLLAIAGVVSSSAEIVHTFSLTV